MPNRSGVWNLTAVLQAKNASNWPTRPDAPTGVSATAGNEEATVSFTPPSFKGVPDTIIDYRATSTPGNITATASSSPITVTGLTNDTSYTFTVAAQNALGYGPESDPSNSVTPEVPSLVLFMGGEGAFNVKTSQIHSVNPTSTGNSTSFGSLTTSTRELGSCASITRAIAWGGEASDFINVISYVEFATGGSSSNFGDLSARAFLNGGLSNNTRGVCPLTYTPYDGGYTNAMEYITIASTGNSTTFGELNHGGFSSFTTYNSCAGSSTRGIISYAGGLNIIEYITIASTGNGTDFGDINNTAENRAACSNSTRAVFGGGNSGSLTNAISYVTIASTGNSTDFGDLTTSRMSLTAACHNNRGVFAGGDSDGNPILNVIDYITITSTGNASNFGDLTGNTKTNSTACSNLHGGLA